MDLLIRNYSYFFETYFSFILSEWTPASLILMLVWALWFFKIRKCSARALFSLLHLMYGAVVLGITLLSWPRVNTRAVLLNPCEVLFGIFSEFGVHYIRAIFSNMCLFIPIGVFSRCHTRIRAYKRALWVGLLFSCMIEIAQYACARGTLETLDVICNVLGALLGVLLIESILMIWRKFKCLYLKTEL